jgi:tetratricopeptide (TPR) repeat protein
LRGDLLLYSKRDMAGALAAYQESLQVNPAYKEGQAAIIELLLVQGKVDDAEKALQVLVKEAPGRVPLYLEAMLAYTKRTSRRHRKNTEPVAAGSRKLPWL